MTSHFIVSHPGCKFKEFEKVKVHLTKNIENVKAIIEPFGGTAALSFHLWKIYGDKLNYYINDKDPALVAIYDFLKSHTSIDDAFNKLNELKHKISSKELFKELYNDNKQHFDVLKYIVLKKMCRHSRLDFYNSRDSPRAYSIKSKPNKHQRLFFEFIKSPNVFITNDDWKNVFDKFKEEDDALFIFDPPYIDSNNTFYKKGCRDLEVYEYFKEQSINTFKSQIYFILEDIQKVRDVFNDCCFLDTYDKTYYLNQKKTKHIIKSKSAN